MRLLTAGFVPRLLGFGLVGVLAVTGGLLTQQGGGGDVTVKAVLADADAIIKGNDVKIDGVRCGVVQSIALHDGKAVLTLSVGREFLPLHKDARAQIKAVSLLGERYVDLTRGSDASPALGDGGTIPVTQTGRVPELDDVLNAVDKPTGQALAAAITALGEGVQGQGSQLDLALRRLQPDLGQVDQLVRLLKQQNTVLGSLVDAATPVAAGVAADDGQRLDRLIASARTVLAATASQRRQLEATLRLLPNTLAQAQSTLAALAGVSDNALPLLQDLRPATDNLSDISGEISRLADAADPALASLEPVLRHGRQLVAAAQPVVAEARAMAPAARQTLSSASQVGLALVGSDEKLSNLLDFIKFWALTTNGEDGLSHYFRAHVIVETETATSPIRTPPRSVSNTAGGPLIPLTKVAAPFDKAVATVTGLTPDQEHSLLSQLLGGAS